MSKPKLFYFDAPVSRGEECRLALFAAGVDFEDVRIKREEWAALKPTTPFGSVPVLELAGKPALGQSNAILVYVGREYGLHPTDNFEAARHEAMMAHVEDLRANIGPTMRISDEAEKKKAREALAQSFLPTWGANAEKQLGNGPFFGGDKLHVVDLKIFIATRWVTSGNLDHIPASVFDGCPKLLAIRDAVKEHERVKAWYARS